jgi:hypothetical protein
MTGASRHAPRELITPQRLREFFAPRSIALDGALRALEVNPLWVNGDQVEALDVLVVTEREEAR